MIALQLSQDESEQSLARLLVWNRERRPEIEEFGVDILRRGCVQFK
jgi:hypothetical protein